MPAACSVRFGKYLPARGAVVDPNAAKARRPALDEASATTVTRSSPIWWPPSGASGQATKSGKPYEIDLHRDSKICEADEPVREYRPVDDHFERWASQPSPGMRPSVNTTTSSPMSKRKTPKGLGGLQDRKNRQRLGVGERSEGVR
jgi:hypothetical protein